MNWDFNSDRPIYTQLVEQISVAIVSGTYKPGEKLPSVRELAAQAGVNPNTMQRAMAELETEGLLFTQRTAGRFITQDEARIGQIKGELAARHIREFLSIMAQIGYTRQEAAALVMESQLEE